MVAEEVAEVLPDLVACGKDGRPEAVRYHFLIPMLLNEVRKEQRTIETQRGRLVEQEREIKDLETRLLRLEETVGTVAYR